MQKNTIAKAVSIVGWCIIVGGIIGALILGYVLPTITYSYTGRANESYNWGLALAVIIGSIISGIFFQAIAEIIRLLQVNADKMDDLIKATGGQIDNTGHRSNAVKDIESNLPQI